MKPIVVEGFINKSDNDMLLNYFNSMTPDVRDNVGFHWGIQDESFMSGQLVNDINISNCILNNYNNIKLNIEDKFKVKLSLKRFLFQTVYPGGEVGVHSDSVSNWHQDNIEEKIYSALVYLTNDYDGGEIIFPNENIELKPKPGTLVYFYGDSETEHGVKMVRSGKRTNWILFFKGVEE